ncbi:P-loop ATPase, Sll1717 family [Stigmatella aurantiaca]|uniref:Conserved uncharacterized protein n=2 Tax=Stigmatella aurantiaca (strain DW4/3-1) TaxID=378806 RepID=E3FR04_STIAD|nr:hypothetical protein [Stigmatella aurantiaca]ADO72037.1 conserved uncharacterized protein [Stigmatella aurantiaca DW4/3-1]
MEPAFDVRRLSFGALSAERDINEGLKSYFVESDAYRNLRDGKKMVALGNRGAGKSAIFKMIAEHERARKSVVIELSPEDYSYELLAKTMLPEERGSWAKHGAYTAAWKHLLYVLVMKEAVRQGAAIKTGAEAKIYEYLRDKHKHTETNPVGMLISYLKRLEGIKIGNFEASLKARELQQLYSLEELAPLLEPLNSLCKRRRVVVLIDELDKGWDKSEDAVAFVAGLFQASVAITQQTPHLRVLISLRRELYESIPALYDDAQKVRDIIQTIEWDEPQLLDLIARRIAHSLPDTTKLSPESRWNIVFSETLDYRKTKSFNYLVDRTLYRPREMIQLAILIREHMVDSNHGLPADYQIISEAEVGYSEERLKDIASEYRFQYPGLRSVFDTFRGLRYNFDRSDLELHCLSIATGEMKVDSDAKTWCADMDPEEMIKTLWHVGFIRARAVGGLKARRRSGSSYLGSHQITSLGLSNIQHFHVHPMFRAFLGMKEAKEQKNENEII